MLGTVAVSLLTSLAIQRVPPVSWGVNLLAALPMVAEYLAIGGEEGQQDIADMSDFTDAWTSYLSRRDILDGKGQPVFPDTFGVKERDNFYAAVSRDGWGGASGHDAPLIAYDAFLGANGEWGGDDGVIARGVLHGGDNDSTGIIACSWHGAFYGWEGVPDGGYGDLEYRFRLQEQGKRIWNAASSRELEPTERSV